MNPIRNSMLVVIGTSAGGMEALKRLVAQFPNDFPAPIFIVNHMSADANGEALVRVLNESGGLTCVHAQDEQVFKSGHIYLAPSDQHMIIVKGKILITKGARENRSRPAIDPLFRSAAVAYGNRGFSYWFLGDSQQAVADLDTAIGLDPHMAFFHLARGLAHLDLGSDQAALTDLRTYVRLAGDRANPLAASLVSQIERTIADALW